MKKRTRYKQAEIQTQRIAQVKISRNSLHSNFFRSICRSKNFTIFQKDFLSICVNFICVNMSKRKYNEEYIKYGFVSVQQRRMPSPVCDMHENSV